VNSGHWGNDLFLIQLLTSLISFHIFLAYIHVVCVYVCACHLFHPAQPSLPPAHLSHKIVDMKFCLPWETFSFNGWEEKVLENVDSKMNPLETRHSYVHF
jgi:hypothetical protein